MIYAIKITQQHLVLNKKLFENNVIGEIRIFSMLPKTFNNTNGFRGSASIQQIYDAGFREFVEPSKLLYEKNGDMYYDDPNERYTYYVIPFTQQEIDDYDDNLFNSDESIQLENKQESEGEQEYWFLRNKMRRAYKTGVIIKTEFKQLRRFVKPILVQLKLGDWDLVLDDLNQLLIDNPGAPAKLVTIINQIITRIDDYVTQNYK